jgi:hypothetical protein
MSTDYDIRKIDTADLWDFAGIVAEQLTTGIISLDMALPVQHEIAKELDRRHGQDTALTAEKLATLSEFGLDQVAESALLHLDTSTLIPGAYVYGNPEATLHAVALEINRRMDVKPGAFFPADADELVSPF